MKKIYWGFVVLLIFLLIGCELFNSTLSPPDWIRGEWHDEEYHTCTWVFTTNNAVYHTAAVSFDFKEIANEPGIKISDWVTDPKYTIEMEESGLIIYYRFTKITDDTLDFYTGGMTLVLTKQ